MRTESIGSRETRGIDNRSIWPVDRSTAMQRLGPQFGVEVEVIAREGEPYVHATKILVPPRQKFVRIRSERRELSDFWKAVNQRAGGYPCTTTK